MNPKNVVVSIEFEFCTQYLADMFKIIQGLAGKQVDGADLPEHAPTRTVGRENKVLVVISKVLGAGVGRPAGEVGVMSFQELGRHGC